MKKPKILLCVTGGIAAYKAIDLASQMKKLGWEIECILSAGAQEFVRPLSFEAIIGKKAHIHFWSDADPIPHIHLSDWADLIVIAPATANIMAKAAQGISDDLLSATLLAHSKPLLFVPAMNVHMFENPATQTNINILEQRGHFVLSPDTGVLACGYAGKGKYPPNYEVIQPIKTYLHYSQDLKGIKVMVSAGATREAIDPMRFISNRSSGKMGLALARALALRGAEVCLIHGILNQPLPHYLYSITACESAMEMKEAAVKLASDMDMIFMCAAVADYSPVHYNESKLPKQAELSLQLTQTEDILAELGKIKKPGQILVGFSAQTDDNPDIARDKLHRKNLDLICMNRISYAGMDDNEITLIAACKKELPILRGDKFSLAHQIVSATLGL